MLEIPFGRYRASVDPKEIDEGLELVERQLKDQTARVGLEAKKSGLRDIFPGIAMPATRIISAKRSTTLAAENLGELYAPMDSTGGWCGGYRLSEKSSYFTFQWSESSKKQRSDVP